jgi:hypothetical protein
MNAPFKPLNRARANRLFLAVAVVLGLLSVLLVSVTGAQDTPSGVNSIAAEPSPVAPAAEPLSFGQAPEGFVWSVNGELVSLQAAAADPEPDAPSIVMASGSGARYYLTDANVTSDQALSTCAAGYHMASLWEIIDPSNLTYAYDHPDAHTKTDSAQGPPSEWYGRVRTGANASVINSAGTGNCAAWTSVDSGDYGTFVRLTRAWEAPPGEIGAIWDAHAVNCSLVGPVWCIRD